MCVGGTPDVPTPPERQAARQPGGDIGVRMGEKDRRRRGFMAAMIAPAAGAPITTNVTGV